ncbi:MAG: hypothetical protein QXK54_04525 [Ignisphaera sp.]
MKILCISSILATIMLIGIVIACIIVTSMISSNLLHQQVPKGTSISIPRATWYVTSSYQNYTYIFELVILNSGTERANIINISVSIGGNKYSIAQDVYVIKPNEWIQVTGSINTNIVPATRDILVEVSFCSDNGVCGTATTLAKKG